MAQLAVLSGNRQTRIPRIIKWADQGRRYAEWNCRRSRRPGHKRFFLQVIRREMIGLYVVIVVDRSYWR